MLAAAGCKLSARENPAYGCDHCAAPNRCVRGYCIPAAKPRDAGSIAKPDANVAVQCKPEGSSRACYDGPDGTSGNGRCREGVQICQDGNWGECSGELLPQSEICNAYDDDCDGQADEDIDLSTSNDNCGVCNHRCPSDRTCCNAVCVDSQTDSTNCGGCGTLCEGQTACCGGTCHSTQSDTNNCGACGVVCGYAEACCYGTCADTRSDADHCGGACAHCGSTEGCCDGLCTDLGSSQHCGACGTACDATLEVCCKQACTADLKQCGDL